MKSPFMFGSTVSTIAFTNRKIELKRLQSNLVNGINTTIISPRRWGKSSLVEYVTKKIRKDIEIYGGVKNILNFIPENPIMRPYDPFDKNVTVNNPNGYTFDPSYNYAPVQGIRSFLCLRLTF